jgi:hypothetical protein|tara:strand:- start:148 stop:654 length:507 start_codon:yes stop_codon:yes gene_type:complete
MGYFEGLTASSFKTDENGQLIFYPWGKLGKGYILPTEAKKNEVRNFVKLHYVISLISIIGVGIIFGWLYPVILLPVFYAWYYFTITKHIKGLTKSTAKLTLKESATSSAKAHNVATLWVLFVFSVLFVIAGIFIWIIKKDEWITALMSITFFGACSIAIAYMIKQRNT